MTLTKRGREKVHRMVIWGHFQDTYNWKDKGGNGISKFQKDRKLG